MAFFRVFQVVNLALLLLFCSSLGGAAEAKKTVKLVNYEFENGVAPNNTVVVTATPSGNRSEPEFGTVRVVTNVLRETVASDSAVLGSVVGLVTTMRDGSLFLTFNFVYDTAAVDWTGTLAVQGRLSAAGSGELVVTGGSGDFRFAQGFCDTTLVDASDPASVVFKNVVHLEL